MSLHADLLTQADRLVDHEPSRPKQATLRRAVSTAYYAVFHFLINESVRRLISGTGPQKDRMRHALARTFSHAEMKKVCKGVSQSQLSRPMEVLMADATIAGDLRDVAAAFVQLQQARHEADYDLSRRFTRHEVRDHVDAAHGVVGAWKRVAPNLAKTTFEARAFLLALAVHDSMKA